MKSLWRTFGYVLCLFGAAFAGFPPPRLFEREQTPEEVLVRVLEEEPSGDHEDVLQELGLRVFSAENPPPPAAPKRPRLTRTPETPTRGNHHRSPRPLLRR